MTDTGQVPGEGLPENAGMAEQPDVPAPGAYAFGDSAYTGTDDDDLLFMPGAQGAWTEAQPVVPAAAVPVNATPPQPFSPLRPAPAEQPSFPQVQAVDPHAHGLQAAEPPASAPAERSHPEPSVVQTGEQSAPVAEDAHEAAGRDTGSVDLGSTRIPSPAMSHTPVGAPVGAAARRPLHLGPPSPDTSNGVVRSLADRGPSGAPPHVAPVRQAGPPSIGPEYLDIPRADPGALPGPQLGAIPPQGADPWAVRTVTAAPPAEEPAGEPAGVQEEADAQEEPAGVQEEQQESLAPSSPAGEAAAEPEPHHVQQAQEAQDAPQDADRPGPGVPAGAVPEPSDAEAATAPEAGPQPVTTAPDAPDGSEDPAGVPAAAHDGRTADHAPTEPPTGQFVPVAGSLPSTSHLAPAPQPVQNASEPGIPAPVDPAPVDPAPVDPAPVDPAAVDPAPGDPATATDAPGAETAAAGPAVAGPVVPEPAVPQAAEPGTETPGAGHGAAEPVQTPAQTTVEPSAQTVVETGEPLAAPHEPAPVTAEEPLPGGTEYPAVAAAPADEPGPRAQVPADAPAPVTEPVPVPEPAPVPEAEAVQTPAEPALSAVPAGTPEGPAESAEPAEASATPEAPATPPAPGYDDAEREAILRVMRERRDIRNGFRGDPIPHDVLLRVLEAAHTAPSVGHSQPWDFVVIRSAETRRAMHELAQRQREAYARSLPKARAKQFKELKVEAILDTPVNIVVTADPTRGGRHTLGRHTQPQMAPYSSALAVENLWLAARAEGLGVGWVSFFDEREMVRALGLPEHLEVVAYLCVGYVDEFPEEPELAQAGWSRKRPLSWVVHEETYGRRALPGEDPHDLLAETVATIRPLDAKALGEAWERQRRMTKPAGALGMLEIISAQLAGLSRTCPPPVPEPAAVAVFAGDHGVHAQGVTPWPQEVTGQMVANFLGGGAVCNAFANQVGAEVCVIDVGVASELPATPGLLPRKVRAGTADFTTGHALTRDEVKTAVEVGIETARDLVAAGNKALITGEMGIANTTVSAALIAVFTGVDAAEVTGRGTGINDETHARKVDVVRRGLELHQADPADPIGVLAAFGGLEHAAMVGLILGGASLRTPVILDGVSAGAAALVARAIAPEALSACIAGHRSAEPGHAAALGELGLRPLVDLDLRLGEGTGALLALPLVQSAARAMHEVATFDSAGVTEK